MRGQRREIVAAHDFCNGLISLSDQRGTDKSRRDAREACMALSKRNFLLGAAAVGGSILLGRSNAEAQPRPRVIDAHTHWYPAEWVELVQKEGEAAGARLSRNERGNITFRAAGISAVFSPTYIDLDSRIKSMEE